MQTHWGIVGMQERTRKIGAALHIQPCDPSGTKIELKLRAVIAYAVKMHSPLVRLLKRIYP